MECNKLLKEALDDIGIEFTYKLDDTLESLNPKQKFSGTQLEGYLKKKGVSPKEIKQSGLLYGSDSKAKPISDWLAGISEGKHRLSKYIVDKMDMNYEDNFEDISLGKKGFDNPSYKETLSVIDKPSSNAPEMPHFGNEVPVDKKTLLGWNRTHTDTINGKETTVLNEFQSDWAQAERAGNWTFKSKTKLDTLDKEEQDLYKAKDLALSKQDEYSYNIAVSKLDDIVQEKRRIKENTNIIADFPMSEQKHHQYQIVEAIDQAIKNGTNRIAIPIERENELMGSAGVTKFYDSLNKKILPEIRKKLEKQGMKIRVSKEDYGDSIPDLNDDNTWDILYKQVGSDNIGKIIKNLGSEVENEQIYRAIKNKYPDITKFFPDDKNTLYILDITPVKGKKVRWDIYSLLGAIGLGEIADKLKEDEDL